MKDWLYTIRWKNLLIIWISIIVIILPHFDFSNSQFFFEFILWAIICSSVAAVGNIFNDLLDVKQDKENKKKNIFTGGRNKKTAYVVISSLLLICIWSVFSSSFIEYFLVLAASSLSLLFLYNLFLKRIPLIGNMVVAFLTALIFAGVDLIILSRIIYFEFGFQNKQIELLICFAFITTLIREIIKDAEDRKGDSFAGHKTIAQFMNDKWLALSIVILSMLGSGISYYLMAGRHSNFIEIYLYYSVWVALITIAAGIFMLVPNPSKYIRATRIVKAGMLGCLAIYLILSL